MSTLTTLIAAFLTGLAVFYFVLVGLSSLVNYFKMVGDEADEAGFEEESAFGKLFDYWATRLSPFVSESFRTRTSRAIQRAGGLDDLTVEKFAVSAVVSLTVALFVSSVIVIVTGWSPLWVLGSGVVGLCFPFIWLRDQVAGRHQEILSSLPYHLDLLTLCVEAGLDFNAGVSRTVEKGKQGALIEELQSYLMELRLGKTRSEALEGMSERVGLPALSTFLSALMQADRMGTNLGRALRIQSDQLRVERFQRAEKLANEAPVKMILPLVLFIFPTIWIILGGPLIFEWLFK